MTRGELIMASSSKLRRMAVDKHKEITRCSNSAARQWIDGEVAVVEGKRKPSADRLIFLDHSIANLVANVCLDAGLSPGETKRFVYSKLRKHYDYMMENLKLMAKLHGGSYKIGDLEYTE